jgi:hypothetical protein
MFIARNAKLVHLDLSYCHLTQIQVSAVLEAVNKSPSLQAVHLTGNPGVLKGIESTVAEITKESIEPLLRP